MQAVAVAVVAVNIRELQQAAAVAVEAWCY
jgi:hypothetical protein